MSKKKKELKTILGNSLSKEEQSVKDRFDNADMLMEKYINIQVREQKTAAKIKTQKVIRDAFTMPEGDHHIIKELKSKFRKNDIEVNKSEIVRVGLYILNKMTDKELIDAFKLIDKVKLGRPT